MPRTFGVVACLPVVFGMSFVVSGPAPSVGVQPTPPTSRGIPVETPGFIGKTATLDTTGYSIGRRIFEAGAHNATWHMHSAGQLIFAESGHGRFQMRGEPIHELAPGDSGYIPAGIMHWHGAVPNEGFTMTFINLGASTTTNGDPLTDDIYLGKAK